MCVCMSNILKIFECNFFYATNMFFTIDYINVLAGQNCQFRNITREKQKQRKNEWLENEPHRKVIAERKRRRKDKVKIKKQTEKSKKQKRKKSSKRAQRERNKNHIHLHSHAV